jgi:sulfur relay protein TusB/DsrH
MEKNKSLAYLYGFSLNSGDKLESLMKILKEQVETGVKINLILIHNGIIGVSKKGETPSALIDLLNLPVKIYAMIPDIEARGMDSKNLLEQIDGINYEDLVDILVNSQKIVSWM